MTSSTVPETSPPRLLSPAYAATTVGMFALCAFVAFEATAVTTVMPTVARELDGIGLFALSFAAPLASGVVGMVAAGGWSDRKGPITPLAVALVLFAAGLVVCGTAPSMEVLVGGRILQGLGGGALTVCLYVLVGMVFPAVLQPAIFTSFAAAWVLPTLFGPALAAFVAHSLGWRWVFLGVVLLVAAAAALVAPSLRALEIRAGDGSAQGARLVWAITGAVAVLALELLGSRRGAVALLTAVAAVVVVLALRRLLPAGTLLLRPGLPAVIATRGLLSGTFFCGETYIIFVLQDRWGLSAGVAGLALTGVGLVWPVSSWVQSRLGPRLSDVTGMRIGSLLVLAGSVGLTAAVAVHTSAPVAVAAYVLAGAGMGFAYPRTSVAMLAESDDTDRGFNSAALSIADSLGGALTISASGAVFAVATRAGGDPFVTALTLGCTVGVVAVVAATRTRQAG
ncbi:MAG: MFS transporter [Nocardioides sp.]